MENYLYELCKNRRSIRRYKEKHIDDTVINEIIKIENENEIYSISTTENQNFNETRIDNAIKRLDVIKEFPELGSGYKIAMRDLSIRGAGDILGREQSGFIDTVGIDLYLKLLNQAINKSKGLEVEEENDDSKNEKPLISVSTHIDDKYVDEAELKILIHKKINLVDSYDSFCQVKEELEDRFGKLDQDMIIYMYEEWFEKLAKALNITNIVDNDKFVDMTLPVDVSNRIKGDDLFIESYNLNHNFRLNYKDSSIHVILDKNKLDKHYLMYLIGILIKIRGMIKEQN